MAKRKCERCGKEYFRQEKFCSACGGKVVDKRKGKAFSIAIVFSLLVVLWGVVSLWRCGVFSQKAPSSLAPSGETSSQEFPLEEMEVVNGAEDGDSYYYTHLVENASEYANGFWAKAVPKDPSQGQSVRYDAFDEALNYLYSLDAERYEVCSAVFDGFSLAIDRELDAENGGKLVVIGPSGVDITNRFIDVTSYDYILGLFRDETGLTVWTCQYGTSPEGIAAILCAKDVDGNIKQDWDMTQYVSEHRKDIVFYGGSTYAFNGCLVNVSNGVGKSYHELKVPFTYLGVDEYNNVYLMFLEENYITVEKNDPFGKNIWILSLEGGAEVGAFHDGLIYVNGVLKESHRALNGLIDENCQYLPWNSDSIQYAYPLEFSNDCAVAEFLDENGESVVTLLNRRGEMLFKPIRGNIIPKTADYANEFNIADHLIQTEEGTVNLNKDGTTTVIIDDNMEQYTYLVRCGENFFRIKDGKIFADKALKEELTKANA